MKLRSFESAIMLLIVFILCMWVTDSEAQVVRTYVPLEVLKSGVTACYNFGGVTTIQTTADGKLYMVCGHGRKRFIYITDSWVEYEILTKQG